MRAKSDRTGKNVYEGVEYITEILGGRSTFYLTGEQVNGKTVTEIAHIVADLVGKGKHTIRIKYLDRAKVLCKNIVAMYSPDKRKQTKEKELTASEVKNLLADLVPPRGDSEVSQLYREQLNFYREENKSLRDRVTKLEQTNKEESGQGFDMFQMIQLLGNLRGGGSVKAARLSDNAGSVGGSGIIPGELLAVLDQVDYSKLNAEYIQQLAAQLKQIVTMLNLPIKES